MASSLFQGQNPSMQINPQMINQAKAFMGNVSQVQGLVNMLKGKGISAEQAVRSICQKNNINVDEFMSMLK